MSVEQAKSFIKKLNSDEAFREQVAAASDNEARLNIAREAGYEFSLEELQQSMATPAEGELSDDQLESVAGGLGNFEIQRIFKDPGTFNNLKVKY